MSGTGQFLLSVGAAALIVGILTGFTDTKSTVGVLTRMVCGLFLAFAVIKPIESFDFYKIDAFIDSYTVDGEASAAAGVTIAEDALRELIKKETEAYILDKAGSYRAELDVQVTVSQGVTPVPESVRFSGSISPYARSQLQRILASELGIPKERQVWIG